ncbi:MAG: glucosyltransferase domain-containing protein [Clostridia bacterium]|nr:glucosyltransferase domain-containing protein [Clostridia bacterium]
MNSFSEDLKLIFKKPAAWCPVAVTALASFLYQLTHFSIGIDDLVRSRYLGGGLFSQGRFSSTLISYMFGFVKPFPFFEPFLAVLFLTAAAFLMMIVMRRASDGGMPLPFLTFFACLLVSYPLINEIFVYKGADLYTGIGFFLTAVSILLTDHVFIGGADGTEVPLKKTVSRGVLRLLVSTLIWIFVMSMYEAFAAVYLVTAALYVFTAVFFRKRGYEKPFPRLLLFVAPALSGIILEFLIGKIILSFVTFPNAIPSGSSVAVPESFSLKYVSSVIYALMRKIFLSGIWYYPVGLFAVTLVLSVPLFIASAVRRKSFTVVWCALACYVGLFGIGLLAGGSLKYRTCQSFAPFTAFIIAFLFFIAFGAFEKKNKKRLANSSKKADNIPRRLAVPFVIAGVLLTAASVVSINKAFIDNDARWKEEKAVLTACGDELISGKYNVSEKPVIFIGEYTLSDRIMERKYVRADDPVYVAFKRAANGLGFKLSTTDLDETYVVSTCQSDFGSVITWGVEDKYGCNEELLLVFKYLGYDLIQGDAERYAELAENAGDLACEGDFVIEELQDVVVVRFS